MPLLKRPGSFLEPCLQGSGGGRFCMERHCWVLCPGIPHSHVTANSSFSFGMPLDSKTMHMAGKIMWGMSFPERVAHCQHMISKRGRRSWPRFFLRMKLERGIWCLKTRLWETLLGTKILSLHCEAMRWHMPPLFWASWPNHTGFKTMPLLDC